jgi:electron transport complex protein RnfB
MPKKTLNPDDIDAILPQTQCGLCSFDGCRPYATAIATQNEAITLCPPGGVEGLKKLAALTGEDPTPFIDSMQQKEKPSMVARIREHECIGCTKCIQACPVDAILGASKRMHTVIDDECSGCELCIEPCPVDCIDMIEITEHPSKQNRADQYRGRYETRNTRLAEQEREKARRHQAAKEVYLSGNAISDKKAAILAAVNRAKQNRKS